MKQLRRAVARAADHAAVLLRLGFSFRLVDELPSAFDPVGTGLHTVRGPCDVPSNWEEALDLY